MIWRANGRRVAGDLVSRIVTSQGPHQIRPVLVRVCEGIGLCVDLERIERQRTTVGRLTWVGIPLWDPTELATLDALTAWREIPGGLNAPMEAAWPYRAH